MTALTLRKAAFLGLDFAETTADFGAVVGQGFRHCP